MFLEARDIISLAAENMKYIAGALLLLSGLAVADQLTDVVIGLVKQASKAYKL